MGRGDRFIAIDPGAHCMKVLLGRRGAQGLRVLDQRRISLREGGGSLAPAEVRAALRAILDEWGSFPVLISLPQRSALSQVVDLPSADGSEIRRLIEVEIGKLSGLNESLIAFDYVRLEPFGRYGNPYWVTFSQEDELRGLVTSLGLEMDEVCEITTSGNALLAACQAAEGQPANRALIDLGAADTSVVIVHGGQGVYASSIPIAGDAFVDAISTGTGQSLEDAEERMIGQDLLNGADAVQTLRSAVDEWRREIERLLGDWSREQGVDQRALSVELFSGASRLPGLFDYLNKGGGATYSPGALVDADIETDFAVGYGTGIMGAGMGRQPVSLIPSEARSAWNRARGIRRFQTVNLALLLVVFLFLGLGILQNYSALRIRRDRLEAQRAELSRVREARSMEVDVARRYERLRPILERQRRTLDVLETLAVLESTANERDVWYALFADRETYVSMPEIESGVRADEIPPATFTTSTNLSGAGDSFIAVATVPGQIEMVRETVGRLAETLNRNSLFEHVDLLSADRRRLLVDQAVVVPERHFVFSLKLAENVFRKPAIRPVSPDVSAEATDRRGGPLSHRSRGGAAAAPNP